MTTLSKIGIGVVVILSLLGAIGFLRTLGSSTPYGAVNPSTQQGEVYNNAIIDAGGVQIGANGSLINNGLIGTCPLIASSFTVAASSSVAMDCAVAGVVKGDFVLAMFATSSSNGAGWIISQASASTTAGYLTFRIVNNTGASAVIPASVASTTQFVDLR